MVLRARWILGGAGDADGEGEAVVDEDVEDEGAGGRTDLLLPGPETLIFARPGDKVEDVEGKAVNEEKDVDERDFAACPAAGLLGEEEAEEHFCPLSSTLDSSFLGCCEDNAEDIPVVPMDSLLLATVGDMVEAALPSFN